jgi:uncharacterized protein (DUF608 family)
MKDPKGRRTFLKMTALSGLGTWLAPYAAGCDKPAREEAPRAPFTYAGEKNNRIAFPLGGIGAGMFCLEGTGALSHMSVRNCPDVFNEPALFGAVFVKGHGAKVLEGPVPLWKKFGQPDAGLGGRGGATWGLPRMGKATFEARFPFGVVSLRDDAIPLAVEITGWSPFTPPDPDPSSMPVAGLEYRFRNTGSTSVEAVFSYNSRNFMEQSGAKNSIGVLKNGFVLSAGPTADAPEKQGDFAIFTREASIVDPCWFRGGWFDPLTMAWSTITGGEPRSGEPVPADAPGASLAVPFTLRPGEEKTIHLHMAWYVPNTRLTQGKVDPAYKTDPAEQYHKPWYSARFADIEAVASFWNDHYDELRKRTRLFTDTFFNSTLPPEVIDAVSANLSILKSTTVLRQRDGRFWCWEGSGDSWGSCHGSCTHVWNYAQAVSHLFPSLERSLRHTEFNESQNAEGHQMFRSNLPITPVVHDFHAASDGQMGGIMKVYREWRISGDRAWLADIYPKVRTSMDYCIRTWDPDRKGVIEEPHHNTYDIEFWGPTAFATSFYAGALRALTLMGEALGEDVSGYATLYEQARNRLEKDLFNGDYFFQEIRWTGLKAPDPTRAQSFDTGYTPEALALLHREGPKYQYGTGCLSDGIIGAWLARMCGLDDIVDAAKVRSHLRAVHQNNFRKDLASHANPQRPTFALGEEGGLLLCSWPKGGKLSLPFVYSNEVWTGIEYQVATHLMLMGEVDKGLDIVRACRARYDGTVRNPFNEYECGHWYARALSSYGLLQGLTGVRFDAVTRILYIDSRVGDFTSYLSTDTGFGNVGLRNGKPFLQVAYGTIPVEKFVVS